MAERTTIEWSDATWTPIRARRFVDDQEPGWPERIGWHCEPASPGCVNCYAEAINLRLGTGREYKAAHLEHRTPRGDSRGDVSVYLDEKMLANPQRWHRRGRKVFVCSMTDLFADFVRDEWIDAIFAVMAESPWHEFQVLTKRSRRMLAYLTTPGREGKVRRAAEALFDREVLRHLDEPVDPWPLPHVHLGVSIEDQRRADERLPDLKATPAARRFVSFEPLLEAVRADLSGIDLAIIGGESGRGARACCTTWVEHLVSQARTAGCAPFVKQLGAQAITFDGVTTTRLRLKDAKGGDMAEWPEALRVRETMREVQQ